MMSRVKRNTYDIFVGNLPDYVDKGYVEHMFKQSGEIAGVVLCHSKYNKSKIAYVKFFCEPDAFKAVEKYKHLCLDGNALDVKMLPPKEFGSSYVKNSYSSHGDGLPSGNSGYSSSATSGVESTIFSQKCGGEEIIVVVCHVENPVTFYGQSVSNLLELAKITEKLQKFCSSFVPVEGLPHINQIYAARFSQDQMWYRCRVTQSEKYKSCVSYIDYGNEEEVNNKDMVVLPDDLVKIPPQSSLFVFKDLKPISADKNKELYDKAVAYLKKMINEQVKLHTVFSTESFYFINKCIFRNVDVYDELQKKGYAEKVSSSSAKYGSFQKTKTKLTNEQNADILDLLPNSKGTTLQSCNNKSSTRSPNSVSSTASDRLKNTTTYKKPRGRSPGRELREEIESLRSKNSKLTKELAAEREKSKALKKEVEALKAKVESNYFEKLDSVILKTQQLFAMRCQHPFEDSNNLEEVYDVIKAKLLCNTEAPQENPDLHEKVERAILKYRELVENIRTSEQSSSLSEHIQERDDACKTACQLMKEYVTTWNGDRVTERIVYLKKLLLELQQKYEKYLEVDVDCTDKSLEDLIVEYRKSKVSHTTSSETLVKNTNDALCHFSSVIDNLQKDITVPSHKTEGTGDSCIRFTKAAFLESLKNVQKAVDAEIIAGKVKPKSSLNDALMAALIKNLVKEIEAPLEAALKETQDCMKYDLLYPQLCTYLEAKPDTSRIFELRKEIKVLRSKIRHKLADKKDLEESDEVNTPVWKEINFALDTLLQELHASFREEHEQMMTLVHAYRTHFCELSVCNPELNLDSYLKCNGLFKENWDIEHFSICAITKRPGMCYAAKFCNESVIIKEYHLNCDEYDEFFKKILSWHSIEDDNVVPVHAVFKSKPGFQAYAMFPRISTLEEVEKEFLFSQSDSGQVLRGILNGLACIHSQDITHSLLNPSTILITSGIGSPTPLLDFSFGLSNTAVVWESKGIAFCPPEKELSRASDMYNFGCLILWMLFPNLQFTSASSAEGVLDITGYKSIVQGLLSNSGYEAVESLLSIDPSARPTAKSLLEKDIFLQLICNSSGEGPIHTSTPVSHISEDLLFAASEVSPVAASEVSPVAASEVSPVAASEVSPVAASEVSQVAASQVSPVAASEVSPVAVSQVSPVAASQVSPVAASQVSPVAASQVSPVVSVVSSSITREGVPVLVLSEKPSDTTSTSDR